MMDAPAIDPALRMTLRAAASLLFLWAATHKLRDAAAFRTALANYDLLPARWLDRCARLLIVAELAVAMGVLLPGLGDAAALLGAALLALYAGAIGVNLRRGRRDIDCGCAGAARRQPLSVGLVVRNLVLAGAAVVSALPAAPRVLTWVDGVTVGAGVIILVLLYAAIDGLLIQAPRLRALGGDSHDHRLLEAHEQRSAHA